MDTKNIFLQDCNLFNSSRNVGFHSRNGRELITAILPFALANACGRWYITDETVDLNKEK